MIVFRVSGFKRYGVREKLIFGFIVEEEKGGFYAVFFI